MTVLSDVIERIRKLPRQQLRALMDVLGQPADVASTIATPTKHLSDLLDVDVDDQCAGALQNPVQVWPAEEHLYTVGPFRDEAAKRLGAKAKQLANLSAAAKIMSIEASPAPITAAVVRSACTSAQGPVGRLGREMIESRKVR